MALGKNLAILRLICRLVYELLVESAKLDEKFSKFALKSTYTCDIELQGITKMRFEGSKTYVATDDLKLAVNAAITLQRPLLIKGEPGTGKTLLAEDIPASALQAKDGKDAIPPMHGALLKNEQDIELFNRLVFMARQGR